MVVSRIQGNPPKKDPNTRILGSGFRVIIGIPTKRYPLVVVNHHIQPNLEIANISDKRDEP